MGIALKNTPTQYGLIARVLHWTSVTLLLTTIAIASQITNKLPEPEKLSLISQHASSGIVLFMVMLARLTWRTRNLNPVRSYSMPAWQILLAISLHRSIYVILIAQCCLGMALLLTHDQAFYLFGIFELPAWLHSHHPLHMTLKGLHYLGSVMIYPLFAVHITAAIYHQVFGLIEEH